ARAVATPREKADPLSHVAAILGSGGDMGKAKGSGQLLDLHAGAGGLVADAVAAAAVLRTDALAGVRIGDAVARALELVDVADQAAAFLVEDEAGPGRGAGPLADALAGGRVADEVRCAEPAAIRGAARLAGEAVAELGRRQAPAVLRTDPGAA